MDFIIANSDNVEIGFLTQSRKIDIDVGNSNDFQLTINTADWVEKGYEVGYRFYKEVTEYGGIIEDIQIVTKNKSVIARGETWRGLLAKKIISPPAGEAYLILSGDANEVIRALVGTQFGDLYVVDDVISGITITNYRVRYIDMLTAIMKMLSAASARLTIYYSRGQVHLRADLITDYSELLEYGTDNRVNFNIRDYQRGINHLICLGSGQLLERQVVHLYLQADGSIGDEQYYFNINERVDTYDNSNAEDLDSLREGGTDALNKLLNYKEMSISIQDIPVELGDIVGGRERITGMQLKKPVINKIIKIDGKTEQIQYKVGD